MYNGLVGYFLAISHIIRRGLKYLLQYSSVFSLLVFCVTVVASFVSDLTLGFSFNLAQVRSLTVILLRLATTLLCAGVVAHTQQSPVLRERGFVVWHDPVQYLYHHGQPLISTPR